MTDSTAEAGSTQDLAPFVQEVADEWEDGPVAVHPAAAARIPEATADLTLQKVEALPYDVFVVVTDDDEDGRELSSLLPDQFGADGVYLVTAPHGTLWSAVVDDGTGTMAGVQGALGDVSGWGDAGLPGLHAALDALAEQAGVPPVRSAQDHSDDSAGAGTGRADTGPSDATTAETVADQEGGRLDGVSSGRVGPDVLVLVIVVAGVLAAVGATKVLGSALRIGRAARERRQTGIPRRLLGQAARMQRKGIRRALSDDTLRLAADLTALQTDELTQEQAAIVRHGLDAYSFAGRLVDAEDATRADLAGALVLLTVVEDDLSRVRSGAVPVSLCTVNPTHGEARAEGLLVVPGEQAGCNGTVAAVCRRCASDLGVGRRPQWLMDRGMPYVQRDTVWARTLFGAHERDLVALVQEEIGARR